MLYIKHLLILNTERPLDDTGAATDAMPDDKGLGCRFALSPDAWHRPESIPKANKPGSDEPGLFRIWWRFTDSNRGPVDYDSIALTD